LATANDRFQTRAPLQTGTIGPNANDGVPPQIESGGFPGGLKSTAALPRRAMITLPRANLSIFVLRKQSKASSGLQKDA
jgi:hypothetical protein